MLSVLATRLEVPIPELTPKAVAALGGISLSRVNVRELRNIIEGALIVSEGAAIRPEHLRFQFSHLDVFSFSNTGTDAANTLSPPVEAMLTEQERLRRALVANGR